MSNRKKITSFTVVNGISEKLAMTLMEETRKCWLRQLGMTGDVQIVKNDGVAESRREPANYIGGSKYGAV